MHFHVCAGAHVCVGGWVETRGPSQVLSSVNLSTPSESHPSQTAGCKSSQTAGSLLVHGRRYDDRGGEEEEGAR